tara:strand:+ start:890 stop:1147 length:258 start_codon:yes stop_codon:yes gene_type:complete
MQKVIRVYRSNIFKNPFDNKTLIGNYFERLYKGEFICARDHVDLRKMVHMMKKQGYPIEKLQCDCDYKYIHSQYYWEFAIQVDPQ